MWYFDVDMATFFPRCYDLSEESDCVAFDTDFKRCAARSILKRAAKDGKCSSVGIPNIETVNVRGYQQNLS